MTGVEWYSQPPQVLWGDYIPKGEIHIIMTIDPLLGSWTKSIQSWSSFTIFYPTAEEITLSLCCLGGGEDSPKSLELAIDIVVGMQLIFVQRYVNPDIVEHMEFQVVYG